MVTLNPKQIIKEWLSERWNRWVKNPIENKTEQLESFIGQKVNQAQTIAKTHQQKAQQTAYKPIGFYKSKPTFQRGLFWIVLGILVILWIFTG